MKIILLGSGFALWGSACAVATLSLRSGIRTGDLTAWTARAACYRHPCLTPSAR